MADTSVAVLADPIAPSTGGGSDSMSSAGYEANRSSSSAREQSVPSKPVLLSGPSRLVDLTTVIVPFFVLIAAIIQFWNHGINWMGVGLILAMYLITGFGITIGFHRLFTHRAFETPRWVRLTLAVIGSMCVQGPLIWWVAVHRQHHHHSDTEEDPHSPHTSGAGFLGMVRGAWHAHLGWLFVKDSPKLASYVPDLLKDRALVFINDYYPLWVTLSLLIPAAAGGLLARTWGGAIMGLVWGGIIRVFMVHHITWSVNSVCHIWGTQPFDSHDQSRNNWIVGVFALGEGWHNNHHAFPTSARHGLGTSQPDVSYLLIRTMERLGLATRVRQPSPEAIAAKLEKNPAGSRGRDMGGADVAIQPSPDGQGQHEIKKAG